MSIPTVVHTCPSLHTGTVRAHAFNTSHLPPPPRSHFRYGGAGCVWDIWRVSQGPQLRAYLQQHVGEFVHEGKPLSADMVRRGGQGGERVGEGRAPERRHGKVTHTSWLHGKDPHTSWLHVLDAFTVSIPASPPPHGVGLPLNSAYPLYH